MSDRIDVRQTDKGKKKKKKKEEEEDRGGGGRERDKEKDMESSTGVHGKKWSEPLCSGDVRTISWYFALKKFGGRPMSGKWRRHPP